MPDSYFAAPRRGWPGPAIADIGYPDGRAALFVACMILGMSLHNVLAAAPAPSPSAEAAMDG
jgi:hypothetical protein